MAHLKHKIPWDLLDSIVKPKIIDSVERRNSFYFECQNVPVEKLIEFSKIFSKIVEEFAETCKPTEEDYNLYHPAYWSNYCVVSSGAQICQMQSLFSTYVILNLIVLNPSKYLPIFSGVANHYIEVCVGKADLNHPKHMVELMATILEKKDVCNIPDALKYSEEEYKREWLPYDNLKFRELNAETLENIRKVCKIYFRCLYLNNMDYEEHGRFFTGHTIAQYIASVLNIKLDFESDESHDYREMFKFEYGVYP